jgi:hypothetical protein
MRAARRGASAHDAFRVKARRGGAARVLYGINVTGA